LKRFLGGIIMTTDHALEPQAGWQHPAQAQAVEAIVSALEKVGSLVGYRPEQIFSDWLRLVESALAALPAHLDHLRQTGQAIETEAIIDAAIFGQASADRISVPAKFLAGNPCPPWPQNFDHTGHIHSSRVSFELFGRFNVHLFLGFTDLHLG
jgi:hypothetical protein